MSKLPKLVKKELSNEDQGPSTSKHVKKPESSKTLVALRKPLSRRSRTFAGIERKPLSAFNDVAKRLLPLKTKRPAPELHKPIIKPKNPKLMPEAPAAPAPTFKKPAPYDFKARFTILQEKHKKNLTELQTLREKYKTSEAENIEFAAQNISLKTELDDVKKQLSQLTSNHEQLIEKTATDVQKLNKITSELESVAAKYECAQTKLDSLTKKCEAQSLHISELAASEKTLTESLHNYKTLSQRLETEIACNDVTRRRMHNDIQDLKGNIRVFCRVRPRLACESDQSVFPVNFSSDRTIELAKSVVGAPKFQDFQFDRVFRPESGQEQVFEELAQLVQSVLDGYNVCVFAYGQTGSGKTYTMEGEGGNNGKNLGMIPRAIDLIFSSFESMKMRGWTYSVKASFLEIYNEHIVDLLGPKGKKDLEIKMTDVSGNDVYVSNLTVQTISSAEELKRWMGVAQRRRAVAATENNERSSRSHAVTKILLEGTNEHLKERCSGALNLVDLAGSERATTNETVRLTETKSINKSLSNLGIVILSLSKNKTHVPYRNSKLTHLLMPSLSGQSKTLMLVNISPIEECFMESVNSLRFAAQVNQCSVGLVQKNRVNV